MRPFPNLYLEQLILLCLFGGTAVAGERYVAPKGDDSAPGSAEHPWRTLQFAATQVRAGDTVTVRPGNYRGFTLERGGRAQAPVRFVGESVGEKRAIIEGRGGSEDGVNIDGASWVEIEGFVIRDAQRAGIRAVQCSHVTLKENRTLDNRRWGVFTAFCNDLLIEGNESARNGRPGGSSRSHGIYVSNSGDRPIIRRNLVHDNRGSGIHMNGDASMGGDGIISRALVESNVLYGNGHTGGSAINCDGVTESIFRNNLMYGNHSSGISLYRGDGGSASVNNVVVNNTIIVAEDGRYAVNIQDGSTGNTVHNNILFNARPGRGSIDISKDSLPGFTSNFNLVVNHFTTTGDDIALTFAQWQAETGQDKASKLATPEQVFSDVGTYRALLPTGPAINAGNERHSPDDDLIGHERPAGNGVDLGAIEYCGEACVTVAIDRPPAERSALPTPAAPVPPGKVPPRSSACAGCGASKGDNAATLGFLALALLLTTRRRAHQ